MPLSGVGNSGFTPIPTEPRLQTRARGDSATRAEQRPSDIPPSHAGSTSNEKADINQLRSVSQAEQTPVQRAATQAMAEKPSLLKRLFTGIAGAISGAFGGIGAGLYATGGALKVTIDLFGGAPLIAAVAGFCVAVFGGAALVAAGILGGGVAGAVNGAREGTFGAAVRSAAMPIDFVTSLFSNDEKKDASKPASG